MELNESIRTIKGIGEKSEKLFNKLGINTVEELLSFYPREYDIFGSIEPVAGASEGKTIIVEVSLTARPQLLKRKNLNIIQCRVRDASGSIMVAWFNMQFLMKTLHMGTKYILRGSVVNRNGMLEIRQPKILSRQEYANMTGKLQPVYPLTAGLTNNAVAKAVAGALSAANLNGDYLPVDIRKRYNLVMWKQAVHAIHFPKNKEECIEARRRLVFDEFFLFALAMNQLKKTKHIKKSHFTMNDYSMVEKLIKSLPYELTDGQKKAWDEIKEDISSGNVMNRLIQGDVGSGKTIISVLILVLAVSNGYQGAIMVPTEVLAKQHFDTFTELLKDFDVNIGLLIGSLTAAAKRKVYQQLEDGDIDIIIGTHALIQDGVKFKNLAVVVTDEQHRFGVRQRETLSSKGNEPHMLVMSATPIPRTLAIILYGDLDVSVIDVLPTGRLPIKNCVVGTNYRTQAYNFIKQEVDKGHQVYVICPMVEESENMEAENVTDYTETLRQKMTPDIKIECLHGKMKPAIKNEIMERFAAHDIDILVSTTVIEVGINVPNATVMMIENAERFGLAQLHQLRGRVGRGSLQSYCIFMAGNTSKETMERLSILGESNDGFYVAEQDLKMRGPGDFFGIRQSGELDFKLADIYQDAEILKAANEAAGMFEVEDISLLCKKYDKLREKISSYAGDVSL
ncbi:MAG: ATP-dependent DNA helicase RecG [Lachnospiraceae bacterium]|nr:ATP-dependent DNA helicase RecG [Lachnospiraceae bacterium]